MWSQLHYNLLSLGITVVKFTNSLLDSSNHVFEPRLPPFLRVESEGMGVQSSIRPIFMPALARALRALWAPGPGVFVLFPPVARSLMCRAVIPRVLIFSATSWAATGGNRTK